LPWNVLVVLTNASTGFILLSFLDSHPVTISDKKKFELLFSYSLTIGFLYAGLKLKPKVAVEIKDKKKTDLFIEFVIVFKHSNSLLCFYYFNISSKNVMIFSILS
jgi:hypothetical protein